MTYSARQDGLASFHYALHMTRLLRGLRSFESLFEMYWLESKGGIP